MKWLFCFCSLFILLDACIDPYPLAINTNENTLVVEGMITDQPGPYTVKVAYANKLSDPIDETRQVNSAKVELFDNLGNKEILSQSASGVYQTSTTGMQGVVGNTYYLRITLPDNTVLESIPEELKPAGEIKNIYYEFRQLDSGYGLDTKNGFEIYVDADFLPEQNGSVRWRTEGIWELKTYPERRLKYESGPGGAIVAIPDPAKCSGFVWQIPKPIPGSGRTDVLVRLSECQCCNCWVTRYDDEPILSDRKFNQSGVTHKFLTFIPANKRFFYNKYHLKVEQTSVSDKVYEFWQSIQKQRTSGSDLFQTPNARTTGNMKVVSGKQNVVGYFGASGVKVNSLFIERSAVPYALPAIDTIAESCLAAYRYSSTAKPEFWK